MGREHLEQLNKMVEAALDEVLKNFHAQVKGVRIQNINIERETLSPPGISYQIKVNAQVTFPVKENTAS